MKLLKYLGILSLAWFIIHIIAGCFVLKRISEKQLERARQQGPFDAIIVPGVPYDTSSGWSKIMRARILWGKYLYDEGLTRNIIFSGSAVYTPWYESKVMAEYGKALGISEDRIFVELQAEHSTENLYYSWLIAKNNQFKKVAVASDPLQTIFLKLFSGSVNIEVMALPMKMAVIDSMSDVQEPVINTGIAFKPNFISLLEREGFFERLRGTRGKKINLKN